MFKNNFILRFIKYINERFPLYKNGLLLGLIFSSFYGLTLVNYSIKSISFNKFCAGIITFTIFFLHLRIMDEFKDFDIDNKYNPTRPVQRGLVSLTELKLIILIIIGIEVILSLFININCFIFILIAIIYSLLMFKEFFISSYLRKHIYIYAYSHSIVILPLAFYISAAVRNYFVFDLYTFLISIVMFLTSIVFEVSIKIRCKQEEKFGIETYSQVSGLIKPVLLLLICNFFIIFATDIILSWHKGYFISIFLIIVYAIYSLGLIIFVFFNKIIKSGKFVEMMTGIFILLYSLGINMFWIIKYLRD
jgi:4-hydroxybenzoate polyprenyltransferase